MPVILVSTQVRMVSSSYCPDWCYWCLLRLKERGPTIVGDESSDSELMLRLNATKCSLLGNDCEFMCWSELYGRTYILSTKVAEWRTSDPPRLVLNKLTEEGYRIIGMAGIGQTCAWTLFKDSWNWNHDIEKGWTTFLWKQRQRRLAVKNDSMTPRSSLIPTSVSKALLTESR